ncbi:hypothetical protein EHS13_18330 [Paenibacillus psychroresistens]|uniref:Uncharacterized protein n=1 Tax=Paenibacillus psychroresistens TaxID=1778678 RepID=A0A6B8RLG5_9BACL|nr:stalk domain-containing protein [Paenibacillus psychroresistens]QGQ96697.1 hypothetical protein EHS13_18330 [Paenibacillus psychroresistens]
MIGKKFKFMRNVLLISTVFTSIVGSSVTSAATNVGWKGMATGAYHSLAIKTDGTLWAWGRNHLGELGNGTSGDNKKDIYAPIQVVGVTDIIKVAAGYEHSLALKSDGTVWAWGSNINGELGVGTQTIMDYQTNPDNPIKENHNQLFPQQVKGLTDVTAIAAGWYASYALKADGTLWYWGNNQTTPKLFDGLVDITSIAIGFNHFIALKKDGSVWTWGTNNHGQLGDGKITTTEILAGAITYIENNDTGPMPVKDLTDVKAISAGDSFSMVLKNDGTVWSWGLNAKGQLGDGTNIDHATPAQVKDITDVKTISAGTDVAIYLKNDGTVWTTGNNSVGQLGIGTYANQVLPIQTESLAGVTQITGGIGLHLMAITDKATLWTWGLNSSGQIGDSEKWNRAKPVWIKSFMGETRPVDSTTTDTKRDLIQVKLDFNVLSFDQPPIIINNRTMVPFRKIFESLGANVSWDEATKQVTATKGQKIIILTIGSNVAIVDGKDLALDTPATILNDRTLVPVRFIAESFDSNVYWDSTAKIVNIMTQVERE